QSLEKFCQVCVSLYDAGLHNRSRSRVRNWVHSRIWPSRDYFLSTPPTRKTTIVSLLRLKFLGWHVLRQAPHGPPARTGRVAAETTPTPAGRGKGCHSRGAVLRWRKSQCTRRHRGVDQRREGARSANAGRERMEPPAAEICAWLHRPARQAAVVLPSPRFQAGAFAGVALVA